MLHEWAPKLGESIEKIPGVVDVMDGIANTISGPALNFKVDPVAAARAGFTPEEVEMDTAAIIEGEPASTRVVMNDRAYTIRVRYPAETRSSVDSIRNALLVSSSGKSATLGSLASLIELPGQTEIRRENLQRDVAVTARLENLNLGAGIAAVQKAVADLQHAARHPRRVRRRLPGAAALVPRSGHRAGAGDRAGLHGAALRIRRTSPRRWRSSSSAILSTSGVFLALLVTGTTFNISSFMGLIMVIGIVAKNGILLLDADQRFRALGASPFEAMVQAGERRLRPILMTALATAAGMVPLALALGAGSQMLQPLAIAVIGGVLASMVLSLVVTPAVHYFLSGRVRVFGTIVSMAMEIEGVTLHLAHPDELPVRWVGQEDPLRQLLAAWLMVDPQDLPMNPRLVGKPGVGKTTLAYAAATRLGREIYIMQATVDTRPEDLLVTPVIEGAGKLRYVASPLVTAMIRGGVAILDEGNRMSEKSWASLAPLLDARRYVESIVAGIKIKAHPDFRFVATLNDDASTFDLPEYIHSRLQPQILIDFPERDEEYQILKENLPFGEEKILEYVTEFLQQAHAADERYTVRDGINVARFAMKLQRELGHVDECRALEIAIIETLGEEAMRYVPRVRT